MDSKKQLAKDIASSVQDNESRFERSFSDKLDTILAHKWLGVIIFAAVMYAIFTISQVYLGPYIADYLVGLIESLMERVNEFFISNDSNELLSGLIVNGIIGGTAAVIGFLPLIMVLFFLLGLLEDSGYMARVAVVMDRFFKKVGLSGKSVIPMYVSTGCAIPGILASKTIKNEKQRRTTVLLSPFIPCGAKGPVIAMFVGVIFFDKTLFASLLTLSVWALSVLMILVAGFIIKALTGAQFADQEDTYLLVELPEYKVPSVKKALGDMWNQTKSFIQKATTLYVLANTLVWFTSSFDWGLQTVTTDHSILASIATPFAFILLPLGFGVWKLAAASIAGFVAKEEVVATISILYLLDSAINEEFEMVSQIPAEVLGVTAVGAFAFMCFNLFTPPCFAAIGAMKTQLNNNKMLFFGIALQFSIGILSSLLVYQIGTILVYGQLGEGFIQAIVYIVLLIAIFLHMRTLAKQGKGLAKVG
jgi:ferrous iron transport protein B